MKQTDRDPWTRRRFLKTTAALSATTALGRSAAAEPRNGDGRPNVLVIVTDQQHAGILSCAGNPWVKTPAMDGLAARGTRFEKAYATCPVCMPSRFSLLTGHYPSRVGVRYNWEPHNDQLTAYAEQSLGHVFRGAGYDTVYGGKVHLPGAMNRIGEQGFRVLTEDRRDGLVDACADYLGQPQDQPFLMVSCLINPHDICYMAIRAHDPYGDLAKKTPRELLEAMEIPEGLTPEEFYAEHCPPLPDNFEPTQPEPGSIEHFFEKRPFRRWVREHWTKNDWRLHRWAYARLTERVDAQIGRILEALDRSPHRDNTVVVFTSDHGDMDAAHRLEHKDCFYEESSRVPLFVCPPRGKAGGDGPAMGRVDTTHLASNGLDLMPTLCDYAGIAPPDGLAGRSLRALAEGRAPTAWRDHVVIENQAGYMIHAGRYKYARYERGAARDLLIDLETDPGEMRNVAEAPEARPILNDLQQRLKHELAERDITWP